MKESIIDNLRDVRKNNNYTQEKFAEKLDISRSKVSSWENGKREMNINDAINIANLCKVSLDNLLEIEEILEEEYIKIFGKFIKSEGIDLKHKIEILETSLKSLKESNLEIFYEVYKTTQNATK